MSRATEKEPWSGLFGNDVWHVDMMITNEYGVFASNNSRLSPHENAVRACVRDAIAGDPDAITAVLMCQGDDQLRRIMDEEGLSI